MVLTTLSSFIAMGQTPQQPTFSVSSWSDQIMRYVVLLLLSMWLLPADAQTKPILQKQLFNMAQQSQQIQTRHTSNATEVLKDMASNITQLHTQTLNQIVQLQGWPTKAQVTEKGVNAAFTLVNYSNNLSFQQNMLPFIIQSYMDKQGISGEAVAILTDKVSIAQGQSQVFGTQADLIAGEVVFLPIENGDSVEQLRAQMGLLPLYEYKKALQAFYDLQK
jgi:hypothetical protein